MAVRFGGFGKNDMLDTVFLKFYKYLLGLKSCTPNCMIYSELGCYPVSVTIQIRIISYWLKLTSSSGNRICRKLYDLLFTCTWRAVSNPSGLLVSVRYWNVMFWVYLGPARNQLQHGSNKRRFTKKKTSGSI